MFHNKEVNRKINESFYLFFLNSHFRAFLCLFQSLWMCFVRIPLFSDQGQKQELTNEHRYWFRFSPPSLTWLWFKMWLIFKSSLHAVFPPSTAQTLVWNESVILFPHCSLFCDLKIAFDYLAALIWLWPTWSRQYTLQLWWNWIQYSLLKKIKTKQAFLEWTWHTFFF